MNSLTRYLRVVGLALVVGIISGCAGFLWDMPHEVDIEQPVPLIEKGWGQRWACQSQAPEAAPIAAADFTTLWGEPSEKVPIEGGERWLYREDGRWCGIWIMVILPIPFELPLCSTYDEVIVRDGVAVRTRSRRFGGRVAGILVSGAYVPIPFPFASRTGTQYENSSTVVIFPASEEDDYVCPPTAAPSESPDEIEQE